MRLSVGTLFLTAVMTSLCGIVAVIQGGAEKMLACFIVMGAALMPWMLIFSYKSGILGQVAFHLGLWGAVPLFVIAYFTYAFDVKLREPVASYWSLGGAASGVLHGMLLLSAY